MKKMAFASAVPAALAALLVSLVAASAAPRTFVSGAGGGAACTRAAPCATFAAALAATDTGGEINCVDAGDYGSSLSIAQSVTIDCGGTFGSMLNTGAIPTITIAGANITVRLRNLSISGGGSGSIGVQVTNAAAVFIENSIIANFNGGSGFGVRFAPTSAGSQLVISDTVLDNNGVIGAGTSGALDVAPNGGTAGVTLSRVRMSFNVTAMTLESANGGIGALMSDSVAVSNRGNGVLVFGGGSAAILTVQGSKLANNAGTAVLSVGSSLVRIGDSTVMGNQIGLNFGAGGALQSLKENHIAGNGNDGTPLPAVPAPGGTPLQ